MIEKWSQDKHGNVSPVSHVSHISHVNHLRNVSHASHISSVQSQPQPKYRVKKYQNIKDVSGFWHHKMEGLKSIGDIAGYVDKIQEMEHH